MRWLCLGLLAVLCAAPIAWCQEDSTSTSADTDQQGGVSEVQPVAPPTPPANAVVLDRVVAVINGDVILLSDVLEEQRFALLQPFQAKGRGSDKQKALDRLIDRTLILQQLKDLQNAPKVTDEEVNAQIAELRKHLPACGGNACETDAGWREVLALHGFTEEEFQQRWRTRMLVLGFIEQRFRAGVRVSKPEIQEYYDKDLVPEFKKRDLPPPTLASVSPRIDEILLQQHVNGLLGEWLNSLKDQGNVSILDPQYKQVASELPGSDSTDANPEGVPQ
jgi:peptidyl-prolyl cis-trans isomerase SurA